jgi:AcrR family transcriptional regulator
LYTGGPQAAHKILPIKQVLGIISIKRLFRPLSWETGNMNSPSEETRQRLLDAAGESFADKGFKGATVRDICRAVQVNIAAVNYHFGDKERMYVEAVKLAHCSREFAPQDWPPGTAPADKLRHFIRQMLTNLLDPNRPDWHGRLMMREMAEPTQACAAVVEAFIRPMATHLMEIVCELLPPGTEPPDVHLTCFSVVGQCLFYRVHKPVILQLVGPQEYATYDVERLADHIARFSLAALGVKEGSPARRNHGRKGVPS